jgi:hypothetical protein
VGRQRANNIDEESEIKLGIIIVCIVCAISEELSQRERERAASKKKSDLR